jgi:bifunctional DNA-binding transcriptional regulator/antitoxin component of YhaV-PrlF toxin-antitoxin module
MLGNSTVSGSNGAHTGLRLQPPKEVMKLLGVEYRDELCYFKDIHGNVVLMSAKRMMERKGATGLKEILGRSTVSIAGQKEHPKMRIQIPVPVKDALGLEFKEGQVIYYFEDDLGHIVAMSSEQVMEALKE